MIKIQCKPVVLNKLLFSQLSVVILIVVVCSVTMPHSFQSITLPLSLTLSTVSILITFYFNKNEVYTFIMDGEILHLDFFNKSFFKRKNLELNRNELVLNITHSIGQIFHHNVHIANVRRNTMKEDEWPSIQNFFKYN